MKLLKLSEIRRDDSAQPRAMLNTDHVKDLSDSLAEGSDLTPIDVFFDGSSYWLADGFHRWSAYHRAKREEIPVTVHEGQLRDAVLYSITANATHAVLKLTREEKRASAARLLRDDEWSLMSNREIARRTGLAPTTVGTVRDELTVQFGQSTSSGEFPSQATVNGLQSIERRGADGRTINTANIGRTRPEPTPEPPADLASPALPRNTYSPPVTPEQPDEDDRLEYDPYDEEDGLEIMQPDAEIVSADEEDDDEPYIPPYVSNPQPSTFQVREVPGPKPKDPPYVEWTLAIGKLQGKGHRSLIAALNSVENQAMENALEVQVNDLIEMLRASKKQAQLERKTVTV